MPSIPCLMASTASSAVRMPLRTMGSEVRERTITGLHSSIHQLLRPLAIMDVKLEPERSCRTARNVLEASSRRGTDNHQSACSTCCLDSCTLAIRMSKAVKCRWRYQNGHLYCSTEQGSAHIAATGIHKHTRSKPNTLKCCAVC